MSLGWLDIKVSLNRFLINFSCQNMSTGKGTAFPVGSQKGDTFFRTDQIKLYLNNGTGWGLVGLDYFLFDFDAHAVQVKFPDHDLIGLKGLDLTDDDKTLQGSVMVGVGILKDTNLKQHDRIIHLLFQYLKTGSSLPLYDISTNADGVDTKKPMKVMAGTSVMPMAKADERPVQFIGVEFGCSITA